MALNVFSSRVIPCLLFKHIIHLEGENNNKETALGERRREKRKIRDSYQSINQSIYHRPCYVNKTFFLNL